ncbi:hypothetical protein ARMGADRAFT_1018907 [Armillaria gallica]|uniref:Uncharacterized protein n=1 Tax=Armillaria gallica TaxID=47427 RepID=A0A2H3CZ85_ARMGA|nr:hypothetical protein ARMGADRAFT_1018907 [Armillaria gallica]
MVSRARPSYSTKIPRVDGSGHSLSKQYIPDDLSQHPVVHRRTGGDQERATRLGNVGDEASRKSLSGTGLPPPLSSLPSYSCTRMRSARYVSLDVLSSYQYPYNT